MDALSAGANPEWVDASLFAPYQNEQALLYEYAECVAVRAFLKMTGLPFRLEQRPNAEFISPNGKVPFLKLENTLIPGFSGIVEFVARKNIRLSSTLTDSETADMNAHIALIEDVLKHAEMALTWLDNDTYTQVTKPRHGSVYLWPLHLWLPFLKRRQMKAYLADVEWSNKSMDEVVRHCDRCFRALSAKLGNHTYFIGDQPTELDALAFGHLYTILTTPLPNMRIAEALKKHQNLIAFCTRIDNELFAS
ncbi:metaxin 2 [Aphelenchoides avenae]|nr:metaxin 2 [Aphelenchus avenae]